MLLAFDILPMVARIYPVDVTYKNIKKPPVSKNNTLPANLYDIKNLKGNYSYTIEKASIEVTIRIVAVRTKRNNHNKLSLST
jgi:hypothetical protein